MESVALSTHRANTVLGVVYNWLLHRHHCEVVIITHFTDQQTEAQRH